MRWHKRIDELASFENDLRMKFVSNYVSVFVIDKPFFLEKDNHL